MDGVLTADRTRVAGMNVMGSRFGGRLPKEERPTMATIAAMEETMNDIKSDNVRVFYDVDEFMNDLLAD